MNNHPNTLVQIPQRVIHNISAHTHTHETWKYDAVLFLLHTPAED